MADALAARPEVSAPQVSAWVDILSGLVERYPRAWIRFGDWESGMLRDEIDGIPIDRPIFIAGLARSGSTILLELLAGHDETATHRYRDFPPVLTPRAWNWFVDHAQGGEPTPRERAHRDRIEVTPDSPEAFEEVIWMAFFDRLHDPARSAVLTADVDAPRFEAFYRDHIRKMLALRGGSRYLSKANYNVTRLAYLLKLFPDARFIVPVRDPVAHIASLMKQHRLFVRMAEGNPRILRHLQRTGHFEFGPDRRPINAGDDKATARIARLWSDGRDLEGWADYWALVYGHVAHLLETDPLVGAAVHIVRHEDFCDDPSGVMRNTLAHCDLEAEDLPALAASRISPPDYYVTGFSDAEITIIRERTDVTANHLRLREFAREKAYATI